MRSEKIQQKGNEKVRGTEKANRTSTVEQESTSYIDSDTSSTNKGSIFILHTGNNSKI